MIFQRWINYCILLILVRLRIKGCLEMSEGGGVVRSYIHNYSFIVSALYLLHHNDLIVSLSSTVQEMTRIMASSHLKCVKRVPL